MGFAYGLFWVELRGCPSVGFRSVAARKDGDSVNDESGRFL
jgi:hypothetical protein